MLIADLHLTTANITLSTADEERNMVISPPWATEPVREIGVLPGQYRVIDGQLCRVVDALPPTLPIVVVDVPER